MGARRERARAVRRRNMAVVVVRSGGCFYEFVMRLAWREGALVWIRMVSLMAIGLSNSLSDCSCLCRYLDARILEM